MRAGCGSQSAMRAARLGPGTGSRRTLAEKRCTSVRRRSSSSPVPAMMAAVVWGRAEAIRIVLS